MWNGRSLCLLRFPVILPLLRQPRQFLDIQELLNLDMIFIASLQLITMTLDETIRIRSIKLTFQGSLRSNAQEMTLYSCLAIMNQLLRLAHSKGIRLRSVAKYISVIDSRMIDTRERVSHYSGTNFQKCECELSRMYMIGQC